jgi:hypothetical protein
MRFLLITKYQNKNAAHYHLKCNSQIRTAVSDTSLVNLGHPPPNWHFIENYFHERTRTRCIFSKQLMNKEWHRPQHWNQYKYPKWSVYLETVSLSGQVENNYYKFQAWRLFKIEWNMTHKIHFLTLYRAA